MTAYLDILLIQAPVHSSGACLSALGRGLLSTLADARGYHCPVSGWSPRGGGAPWHPALPLPWKACLSHRYGRVIAGIATSPVGIDMEHTRLRHEKRLPKLVACLPEADVRRRIHQSPKPLDAFYRAWTLHEALFKLDSLSGTPSSHVLSTRLERLAPGGDIHAWQWQQQGWTISLCTQSTSLEIRTLPNIPFMKLC